MQEINELKNLVVQSLESHGVLSQLRAQIRSSVFKIIDMQETQNNKRQNSFFWENPLCQKIYENEYGSLAVELITELLQFYKMDYTLSVFPHESNIKEEVTRDKVAKKLGINSDNDKGVPLLVYMIKAFFSNGGVISEKKSSQDLKNEEIKEEVKENIKVFNKDIKDNINKETLINKDNKKDVLIKEQPREQIIQKKEPELSKEIPKEIQPREVKKQEIKEPANIGKPQIQPLPINMKQNQKNDNILGVEQTKEIKQQSTKNNYEIPQLKDNNIGSSEINKEKKTLAETQQKLGDMEKKIVSKQIAEIPALPIKYEVDKLDYNAPPGFDKKKMEKKEEISNNYDDEHFDEYNEDVHEEIFQGEDDNLEEMMYKQQEGQNDFHQGVNQSSDENFGASQSQGFDILVNSTTLEEYDYFEDVMKP